MSRKDGDRFRVKPRPPASRDQAFITRVVTQLNKAGSKSLERTLSSKRASAKLGRGHVAAGFAGQRLGAHSRRVVIKTRLVHLRQAGPRSTATHLRYIERDGVGRDGTAGQAYGPLNDQADLTAFEQQGREDRHQFRFIVALEDAEQLEELRPFTRELMQRMEADLGTRLDWVAVDHWDTDNPHTHIVLRGKDERGHDLVIARDYISRGMRQRASELATEWLGPRTELELRESVLREVGQERWTSLDQALQREVKEGVIRLQQPAADPPARQRRALMLGRLQRLSEMGLAEKTVPDTWSLKANVETTLRAMGERGDIIRTIQRAMRKIPEGVTRELAIFNVDAKQSVITGKVVGKGLVDELQERGYLIVDGIDGRAHYVQAGAKSDLKEFSMGAIVSVRGTGGLRAADQMIAKLSRDGLYRTEEHLVIVRAQKNQSPDPEGLVQSHVRRLEALRRAGIVERLTDGTWKIPADLPERGQQFDAQRLGGTVITLRSHLSIERQTRAIGATWLDQQLIENPSEIAGGGFAAEVRTALTQRTDFLVDQRLAQKQGQRVFLARNLLATLRERDIAATAQKLQAETGLLHRPVLEGGQVSGIYQRSVLMISGRFAMLVDGLGFSLVPWRPAVEQRLGQNVSALLRDGGVSWELSRQRTI